MQLVEKDSLKYDSGYLVKGDDIVGIDGTIIVQLNVLEKLNQRNKFYSDNPRKATEPDKPFEFTSEHEIEIELKMPETPILDKEIEKSLKLCSEIDTLSVTKELQSMMSRFKELLAFVDNDKVLISFDGIPKKLDLKTLGNPIHLTQDKVISILTTAAEIGFIPER
jgi:hypothetical protein